MKGVIILPKYLESLWTPKINADGLDFSGILSAHAPFYYALRDFFKFELRYVDEVDVDSDTDIVFIFGVPYHNRPKLIPGILELNKNTKLVLYPGDLQCYGSKLCLKNKIKVFKKSDLIITPVYEYFVKTYPQFMSKYEFFPNFFSTHTRYIKLPFNDNPKMQCLLSGSLNSKIYPLRSFIKKDNSGMVIYKPPKYLGDSYAELLHSYFCCVTSSSIFNYVIAKYFEIPATGSLLLANETEDLKRVGFIPNHHYVPITKDNVFKTIDLCIKNPNDYTHIRKNGMEFVRNNHSVLNRVERLGEIFDNLLNA